MRFTPLIGTALPLLGEVCLIHSRVVSVSLGPWVFPVVNTWQLLCQWVLVGCSECPMPCCAELHGQGKAQQCSSLEWAWDFEPGSGDTWPGTGMAAAPQAWAKGSSQRGGWPHYSQPHSSSLVLPLPCSPCAQSRMVAAHSGLPESFSLPGDFSSARSCDCSLKGKAFLAEGDINFSLYQQ